MGRPTGRQVFCSFTPQFGNNAPTSDNGQPNTLQISREKSAACGLPALAAACLPLLLTACQDTAAPPAPSPPVYPVVERACGATGFLRTELYGAIETAIDWQTADLECEGMARPERQGARLRFAGNQGEHRIAIIIGMPTLEHGSTGKEIASNVTLIEEGAGRFFSTPDLDNCWTDVTTVESTDASGSQFEIGGTLYCVKPMPEVNGRASVSMPELEFRGLLDWGAS